MCVVNVFSEFSRFLFLYHIKSVYKHKSRLRSLFLYDTMAEIHGIFSRYYSWPVIIIKKIACLGGLPLKLTPRENQNDFRGVSILTVTLPNRHHLYNMTFEGNSGQNISFLTLEFFSLCM